MNLYFCCVYKLGSPKSALLSLLLSVIRMYCAYRHIRMKKDLLNSIITCLTILRPLKTLFTLPSFLSELDFSHDAFAKSSTPIPKLRTCKHYFPTVEVYIDRRIVTLKSQSTCEPLILHSVWNREYWSIDWVCGGWEWKWVKEFHDERILKINDGAIKLLPLCERLRSKTARDNFRMKNTRR